MNQRKGLLWSALITVSLAGLGLAASFAAGCGHTGSIDGFTCPQPFFDRKDDFGRPDPCCNYQPCCPNPIENHIDHWNFNDPCCLAEPCPGWDPWKRPDAGTPPADAGEDDAHASTCSGQCLPVPDAGWSGPLLLWMGSADQDPPSCPEYAPHEGYRGVSDLWTPPITCPSCACDAPNGACGLPSKVTANSTYCAESKPGTAHTDFDPPEGWDGTCTTHDAIPAGAHCNGGLCVQSLSIGPLSLSEGACRPQAVSAQEPNLPPVWQQQALACQTNDVPPCDGTAKVCAPAVPPSAPGFSTCIFRFGDDRGCPAAYPVQHVFHDGYEDNRACSDCKCGAPEGGKCTALLSVYQDSACKGPLVGAFPSDAEDKSPCSDIVPAGLALGSKTISTPVYTPGACAPFGSAPIGTLVQIGPATFCCVQS